MDSEISSDKQKVKRLRSSPVNRGIAQGYTVSFPVLITATREYKYRSSITVYPYIDDIVIERKEIPPEIST